MCGSRHSGADRSQWDKGTRARHVDCHPRGRERNIYSQKLGSILIVPSFPPSESTLALTKMPAAWPNRAVHGVTDGRAWLHSSVASINIKCLCSTGYFHHLEFARDTYHRRDNASTSYHARSGTLPCQRRWRGAAFSSKRRFFIEPVRS